MSFFYIESRGDRKAVRTYGDERLPDFERMGPMDGASIETFRRSRSDIGTI